MISLSDILYGVLLPAAISLVIMLLAWRPWSGGSPKGHWAGAFAIGAAFAAGLLGLQTRPAFPPNSAEDWLFHAAWIIAIIGLLVWVDPTQTRRMLPREGGGGIPRSGIIAVAALGLVLAGATAYAVARFLT